MEIMDTTRDGSIEDNVVSINGNYYLISADEENATIVKICAKPSDFTGKKQETML